MLSSGEQSTQARLVGLQKTWQNSTDKSYEPGESTAISLRQVVLCSFEPFISM